MRGNAEQQAMILSAVTPDQLVPQDHLIRQVKPIVDRALAELSPTFNQMYARVGRPSIPPEHLLKGCLLIALYSIRSERQFCERLQYDLLFKWFLDLNIMDQPSTLPLFPRTRPGYWSTRCPASSSAGCWPKPAAATSSRRTISLWMEPCWKPGPP